MSRSRRLFRNEYRFTVGFWVGWVFLVCFLLGRAQSSTQPNPVTAETHLRYTPGVTGYTQAYILLYMSMNLAGNVQLSYCFIDFKLVFALNVLPISGKAKHNKKRFLKFDVYRIISQ
jgi:hypothetical protein